MFNYIPSVDINLYTFIHYVASIAAQEIFKLLPHTFVDPSRLPELFDMVSFILHFHSCYCVCLFNYGGCYFCLIFYSMVLWVESLMEFYIDLHGLGNAHPLYPCALDLL